MRVPQCGPGTCALSAKALPRYLSPSPPDLVLAFSLGRGHGVASADYTQSEPHLAYVEVEKPESIKHLCNLLCDEDSIAGVLLGACALRVQDLPVRMGCTCGRRPRVAHRACGGTAHTGHLHTPPSSPLVPIRGVQRPWRQQDTATADPSTWMCIAASYMGHPCESTALCSHHCPVKPSILVPRGRCLRKEGGGG